MVEPNDAAPYRRRHADDEQPQRNRYMGLIVAVGLTMGAAAICGVVLTATQDKAVYSKPVDTLLAEKLKFLGRPVRAEGLLVHGSLVKREQPCEYRFVIEKNGAELPVHFGQCVIPDNFRDVPNMDMAVTVEGELKADNSFEASSVLAKCPSTYEMQQRKKNGEQMPHGPLARALPGEPSGPAAAMNAAAAQ
jgi:cytochrome c-type biogenesis protein CcmE